MSDLFGLSILMIIFYNLIRNIKNMSEINLIKSSFLTGILIGVRISFIPFLLPLYFLIIRKIKIRLFFKCISSLSIGLFLWLIPLILITGLEEFVNISLKHINGHFFNWGGGVLSSNSSFFIRIIKIIESIWADGLGCWWNGRHWLTAIVGVFTIILSIRAIKQIRFKVEKKELIILFYCVITYFIWIFLFQNIIYKPRHIIVFIPFILLFFNYGIINQSKKSRFHNIFIGTFLITLILTTSILNWQHKKPSALNQVKNYVIKTNNDLEVFYSSKLINNYIKKYKGSENIVFLDKNSKTRLLQYYNSGYKIYSTIRINDSMNLTKKESFYHNSYVNRLWPHINIYSYKK